MSGMIPDQSDYYPPGNCQKLEPYLNWTMETGFPEVTQAQVALVRSEPPPTYSGAMHVRVHAVTAVLDPVTSELEQHSEPGFTPEDQVHLVTLAAVAKKPLPANTAAATQWRIHFAAMHSELEVVTVDDNDLNREIIESMRLETALFVDPDDANKKGSGMEVLEKLINTLIRDETGRVPGSTTQV